MTNVYPKTRTSSIRAQDGAMRNKIRQFRLVLLGQTGVGKSSFVLRFVKGHFHQNHSTTVGASFFTQIVQTEDATVKFEIWDTAGQERFHSMTPFYYRDAKAAIVMYDIQDAESFVRAQMWVKQLREQALSNIVIALAGNKIDLTANRAVNYEDAQSYAEENGLIFMETSAKAYININEIFSEIARKLTSYEQQQNIQLIVNHAEKPPELNCCINIKT